MYYPMKLILLLILAYEHLKIYKNSIKVTTDSPVNPLRCNLMLKLLGLIECLLPVFWVIINRY